jgi:hypothetical protein
MLQLRAQGIAMWRGCQWRSWDGHPWRYGNGANGGCCRGAQGIAMSWVGLGRTVDFHPWRLCSRWVGNGAKNCGELVKGSKLGVTEVGKWQGWGWMTKRMDQRGGGGAGGVSRGGFWHGAVVGGEGDCVGVAFGGRFRNVDTVAAKVHGDWT